MRVVFSIEARTDLSDVAAYIAGRGAQRRAWTFIRELRATCAQLAIHSGRFAVVTTYRGRSIRRAVHDNYLIYYSVSETEVVIVRVLPAARDLDRVFPPGD